MQNFNSMVWLVLFTGAAMARLHVCFAVLLIIALITLSLTVMPLKAEELSEVLGTVLNQLTL